jgi:hypothetical protein
MEQISFLNTSLEFGFSKLTPSNLANSDNVADYCAIDLYDMRGRWSESLMQRGVCFGIPQHFHSVALFLSQNPCPHFLIRHGRSSGSAEPDHSDIQITRAFATMAKMLGVRLHDYIVEANTGHFSSRKAGLL